jgi:hypothetical protein
LKEKERLGFKHKEELNKIINCKNLKKKWDSEKDEIEAVLILLEMTRIDDKIKIDKIIKEEELLNLLIITVDLIAQRTGIIKERR